MIASSRASGSNGWRMRSHPVQRLTAVCASRSREGTWWQSQGCRRQPHHFQRRLRHAHAHAAPGLRGHHVRGSAPGSRPNGGARSRLRSQSAAARTREASDPHRQHRARRAVGAGGEARCGARLHGHRVRYRSRPSSLALCPAQRRRAGRRNQCPAQGDDRPQGLRDEAGPEDRRRGDAEPEPHHACCATRTRTASPRRARCS